MMNKQKNLSAVLVHRNFEESTIISSPVVIYTHIVKLNSLNGLIKLTLNIVNNIRQFSKINSIKTLRILLNHKLLRIYFYIHPKMEVLTRIKIIGLHSYFKAISQLRYFKTLSAYSLRYSMINAQQEKYIDAINEAITLINESITKKEEIKRNLMKSTNYVENCSCKHYGGNSGNMQQHKANYQEGHGGCMVQGCPCVQFTWVSMSEIL